MARRRSRSKESRFYSRSLRLGVIIALSTGISFAYVWLHIQTVGLGYRIKKAEGRLKLYSERSDALKLKISRLKAPRRIERLIEKEAHKFVVPDERRIVRMSGRPHLRQFALMGRGMKHSF